MFKKPAAGLATCMAWGFLRPACDMQPSNPLKLELELAWWHIREPGVRPVRSTFVCLTEVRPSLHCFLRLKFTLNLPPYRVLHRASIASPSLRPVLAEACMKTFSCLDNITHSGHVWSDRVAEDPICCFGLVAFPDRTRSVERLFV